MRNSFCSEFQTHILTNASRYQRSEGRICFVQNE